VKITLCSLLCFAIELNFSIKGFVLTFADAGETLKTFLPALFFLIQNNLQYVAASYLDVPTNIILYQTKLLWA